MPASPLNKIMKKKRVEWSPLVRCSTCFMDLFPTEMLTLSDGTRVCKKCVSTPPDAKDLSS